MPDKARSKCRTCPKLRLGSRNCARANTSPLAWLLGSHQPRPPWLTITSPPAPHRYFQQCRVLSVLSSFQALRSSSVAQLTPAFRLLDLLVLSVHRPASPVPGCGPATACRAWDKGGGAAPGSGATHPCGASGTRGSRSHHFESLICPQGSFRVQDANKVVSKMVKYGMISTPGQQALTCLPPPCEKQVSADAAVRRQQKAADCGDVERVGAQMLNQHCGI